MFSGIALLQHWRTIGAVLVLVAFVGYVEWLRVDRDGYRNALTKERAAFAEFKTKVAAEGEIQRQRAEAIAAHDELLKEEADHDHAVAIDRLRADLERVRHERDSARRGFLSAAPAGSKCPDGQACFDRAEFERAYGVLVADLRRISDEGSEVAVALRIAQEWAQGHGR